MGMTQLDHMLGTNSTPEMADKVKAHLMRHLKEWRDTAMLEIRMGLVLDDELEIAAEAAVASLCKSMPGPIIVT